MLTKKLKVIEITVMDDNSVRVLTKVTVNDGINTIAEQNRYHVIREGDSLTGENKKVKSICDLVWS